MRNKFDGGDAAEYLDDLGRYRATERALEKEEELITFVEEEQFCVILKSGTTHGPFNSYNEAFKWAKKNSPLEKFNITALYPIS